MDKNKTSVILALKDVDEKTRAIIQTVARVKGLSEIDSIMFICQEFCQASCKKRARKTA